MMEQNRKNHLFIKSVFLLVIFLFSCRDEHNIKFYREGNLYSLENTAIKFSFDEHMRGSVFRKHEGRFISMIRVAASPHSVIINGRHIEDFEVIPEKVSLSEITDSHGSGKIFQISGVSDGPSGSSIGKTVFIEMYEKFPAAGIVRVQYENIKATPGLSIEREFINAFKLDASLIHTDADKHDFWILQGGSYKSRPDWILPVTATLACRNYMGKDEEAGNSGGGLPVLDVWNKDMGIFIGSVSEKPELISLPDSVDKQGYLHISIESDRKVALDSGLYQSIPTVVGVHSGDYFNGLRNYAAIMAERGFKMLEPEPSDPAYGAVWCGWGLGPNFTQKQMTGMIPVLKELNFSVVTVDDGWFESYGDFIPKQSIFPGGDKEVSKFTEVFHEHGYPLKLWMTPGVAGTALMKAHPEWLLKDKNSAIVSVGRFGVERNAAFLCPALQQVQDYYRRIVSRVIGKWGFDGFKMDFSITNAMGECYAAEHRHSSPAESFQRLPELYKIISEETRKLKPKAILEMCPCGVFPSFYKMPYYNQPVASDPNSSWQIRHRAKTIKALMGPRAAFYGDHVERFYSKNNFASMIGVGAIPGSKFVAREKDDGFLGKKYPVYLDPGRRKNFERWLKIYKDHQLASGDYLNLYDIAYDKPETHVIKKAGKFYYAFYADTWDGDVELRGLKPGDYRIIDYVEGKSLQTIQGGEKLHIKFNNYFLIMAIPLGDTGTEERAAAK